MRPAQCFALLVAILRDTGRARHHLEIHGERGWADEIRRRLAELDAGTAETLTVEEARRFITSDAPEDD